jgi:GreA/GreB family transcription elongation factor
VGDDLDNVALGRHVKVELVDKAGRREPLAFDLVSDDQADFASGLLSANTPLAKAILGKSPGSVVPYRVGDLVQVNILSVTASERTPSGNAAAQREEKLRQALNQADLSNAISFALTFDSKWGDYDPEGIAANWDESRAETKSAKTGEDAEKKQDPGSDS